MKYLKIITCILFGIIRSFSGLSAQESIPDSLIDIKLARYTAETDPDKALRIVELVRQQKKAPEYQIDWVITQIYGKKGHKIAVFRGTGGRACTAGRKIFPGQADLSVGSPETGSGF